jgi:hypothetical protein
MWPGKNLAATHCIGVAVDAKDAARRCRQQCLAMAAAAKGAIDIDGISARRQRIDHGVEKNRNVPG